MICCYHLFWCSYCLRCHQWETFRVFMSLWHIIIFLWALLELLSRIPRCSDLSCTYPAVLELAISPRILIPSWRMIYRNQNLGARCHPTRLNLLCYVLKSYSQLLSVDRARNHMYTFTYTERTHIHTHTDAHTC